jgi:hypothetical protein
MAEDGCLTQGRAGVATENAGAAPAICRETCWPWYSNTRQSHSDIPASVFNSCVRVVFDSLGLGQRTHELTSDTASRPPPERHRLKPVQALLLRPPIDAPCTHCLRHGDLIDAKKALGRG